MDRVAIIARICPRVDRRSRVEFFKIGAPGGLLEKHAACDDAIPVRDVRVALCLWQIVRRPYALPISMLRLLVPHWPSMLGVSRQMDATISCVIFV